ncbi:MAG: tetratricopeptide repeat protein [Rhodospirillales bacterium]|nr:tetratricopeptide repeat protein [Rhodospirillales bacterium]MBO6786208.1 tetratricopeptide repeat protein [Rhodospirillales bacterium]
MADNDDDALIREIDEELRQEQAQKLWKAYGNYVIGVAVAVVVVVASYQGWRAYDRSVRMESTDRLIGAATLAQEGQTENAIESLAKLEGDGIGDIEVLAKLRRAALLAKNGDAQAAADLYAAIAADSNSSKSFRDLATLLNAVQLLDLSNDNAQTVIDNLQPLIADNGNWRHSAREVSAVAAISIGQKDKALDWLQAIALDPQAPGGVRSRAQELLQAIGQ